MEEPTREMEKETGAENDLPETEPAAEQEEAKKAAEAKEAEAAEETAEDGKERKFFKKKKDKKDEKIEELTDRLTRQMAEFDNFRKRTEKEKTNMYAIGAKDIIEKILPVVDSFERGLATVENPEEDPFADGMNKVYKQFTTALVMVPIESASPPCAAPSASTTCHSSVWSSESAALTSFVSVYPFSPSTCSFVMFSAVTDGMDSVVAHSIISDGNIVPSDVLTR